MRVIISVPHSGTRSLADHLGIDHHEQGLKGGRWWHFRSHQDRIINLLHNHPEAEINIPIRHPLNVAKSWASRDKTGDVLGAMLICFDHMFDLYDQNANITLHRVEDLPRTKGMDEWVDNPSTSRIQEFQDAVTENVLEPRSEFYETMYGVNNAA